MHDQQPILAQAEAIAREAKRVELDQLLRECDKSEHSTLRSLADVYRRLGFGFY